LLDDAIFPSLHLRHVQTQPADVNADLGARLGLLVEVGVGDQRLTRDAAPVEAHAAVLFFLNASHPQTKLAETDGAGIPAGSAPGDDRIELLGRCLSHEGLVSWVVGTRQTVFAPSPTAPRHTAPVVPAQRDPRWLGTNSSRAAAAPTALNSRLVLFGRW